MNKEETQMQNPMGFEPIGKLMIRFAIPATIALIINALYNIVDQIFIGNMVGYLGNAATNIIFPLTVFAIAVPSLLGEGCAAFFSLQMGKGEQEKGSRGICNTLKLIISFSVALMVLSEIFMPQLCKLFGATTETMPYALYYGRIIALGFPFISIAVAMSALTRADGSPRYGMVGMLGGTIINIVLDPLFIYFGNKCWGPAAGVAGAALATIAGQIFNGIWFMPYFKKFKNAQLKKEYFRLKMPIIKQIVALGLSGFILQICVVMMTTVINNMLVKYGAESVYGADIPMAAMGITLKINSIVIYLVQGIATGTQPIIGFNYGAQKYDRTKKAFSMAVVVSTIVMFICCFVIQMFPMAIISLFGDESPLYNEFAVKSLRIYTMLCPLFGLQMTTGYFLQSVGKPLQSSLNTMTRQFITIIPIVMILSAMMGVEGTLWAGPVSDVISFLVSIVLLKSCWKKVFPEHTEASTGASSSAAVIQPSHPGVIITIAREHGSSGKQIGKLVAEKLNVPFYYKETTALAAQESGLSQEFISDINKNAQDNLYDLYLSTKVVQDAIAAQHKVLHKIAESGSCVIVGRAADYVLKDLQNVVRVFVYAPEEYRIGRVMEVYGDTRDQAESNIHRSDEARSAYYRSISGQEWGNRKQYDLLVDSSIGLEATAEMILQFVVAKEK